jgi:hypothetical protein
MIRRVHLRDAIAEPDGTVAVDDDEAPRDEPSMIGNTRGDAEHRLELAVAGRGLVEQPWRDGATGQLRPDRGVREGRIHVRRMITRGATLQQRCRIYLAVSSVTA